MVVQIFFFDRLAGGHSANADKYDIFHIYVQTWRSNSVPFFRPVGRSSRGNSHIPRAGALVVSLRGFKNAFLKKRFWRLLGCSEKGP